MLNKTKGKARPLSALQKAALGLAAAAAVAALAAGGLYLFHGSLRFAKGAELILTRQTDGSLLASWPEVESAGSYWVRAECAGQTVYEGETAEPGCQLPAVEAGSLTVRVQPARTGRRGAAHTWQVEDLAAVDWPVLDAFDAQVDRSKNLRFSWKGTGGDVYLLYRIGEGGAARLTARPDASVYSLPVGGEGELPMPAYGETLQFVGGYGCREGDVVFCGPLSEPVSFQRSDFLDHVIHVSAEPRGDNFYRFTWNEAQGDYYLLQYCSEDVPAWQDLCRVECSESPGCDVRLGAGTAYRLRVVSRKAGAEGAPSQSGELALTTGLSALYATVWPIQDLELYRDASRREVLGTVSAVSACCVLDEAEGLFYVLTRDGVRGYIDSRYCLIDLPDYMGELCAYDITNSYSSLYMVHGYEIPTVTGTVVTGYEHVRLEEGEYLVPLLYPCAQKLAAAAQAARADGYRLKIYDAYRPREASTEIYRVAEQHLNDPIPDETFTGKPVDDLPDIPLLSELLARQEAAAPAEGGQDAAQPTPAENSWLFGTQESPAEEAVSEVTAPPAASSSPQAPAAETPLPEEAPPAEQEPQQYLTYYLLMTGGRYRLGSFLAQYGSTHNLGIAMDLTLERLDTREELQMQTAMHDLSHYAVLTRNNDSADLLADYMLEAGFDPLTSEWWHFQDDATRDALGLSVYQEKGVSPEGWRWDAEGWYYRQADGTAVRKTPEG